MVISGWALSTISSLISASLFIIVVPVELWFMFAGLVEVPLGIDQCSWFVSDSLEDFKLLFGEQFAVWCSKRLDCGEWVSFSEDGVLVLGDAVPRESWG